MSKNISCLRCSEKMSFLKTENIQLGKRNSFWGELSNLAAGALLADIYVCPNCGRLEFFSADKPKSVLADKLNFLSAEDAEEDLPQVQCPECGKWHDFDYPKCPFCNHKYDAE